jgi:hypothetical protein
MSRARPEPARPTGPRCPIGKNLTTLDYADPLRRDQEFSVSKKTKKRKLRARRNKANHGKRPNVGRR